MGITANYEKLTFDVHCTCRARASNLNFCSFFKGVGHITVYEKRVQAWWATIDYGWAVARTSAVTGVDGCGAHMLRVAILITWDPPTYRV